MLLGLLEEGPECLTDISQAQLVGLAESLPIPFELFLLEVEVGLEGGTGICRCRNPGTAVVGSPPRNDTWAASTRAWLSSWERCLVSSAIVLTNSGPVTVEICRLYCTIDWYSLLRSSLRRAMNFCWSMLTFLSGGRVCLGECS